MAAPKIQILVCTNQREPGARKPSCAPLQATEVARRFKSAIRARDLKDEVMVVRTGCLKHCSQGLVVCLWPRNLWYRQVQLDDVEEIVERSVLRGERIERLAMPDIPWE